MRHIQQSPKLTDLFIIQMLQVDIHVKNMFLLKTNSLRVAEAQPPQTKVTTATLRQRGAL